MADEILGYTKDGMPIREVKPGVMYTQAFIMCVVCNKAIRAMGGPSFGSKCPDCYHTTEKVVEKDIHGNPVNTDDWNQLWASDPECVHDIKAQTGGGVKCVKCGGWFCF